MEARRGEKPIDPFERAVAGLALGGEGFVRRLVRHMKATSGARRDEPSGLATPASQQGVKGPAGDRAGRGWSLSK